MIKIADLFHRFIPARNAVAREELPSAFHATRPPCASRNLFRQLGSLSCIFMTRMERRRRCLERSSRPALAGKRASSSRRPKSIDICMLWHRKNVISYIARAYYSPLLVDRRFSPPPSAFLHPAYRIHSRGAVIQFPSSPRWRENCWSKSDRVNILQ